MAKLFNRAKMTTSTTGTGTITLGSASNGFQSFADAGVANGDVVQYVIEEGSNFEIGTGTYTSSGTTLTRTPTESSNSDNAISLAGNATVSITAVAADMNRLQHEGSDKVTVSSTGASVTGNISVTGTVDGRDVATDGSKLDGIESGADVTDTTNVTAAGALMDSEVTNLAQVKAFDSSDYATAAQGTKADNALPKAGGTMTGAITFASGQTFDGRDVSADGSKLDGIESGAEVNDPSFKNIAVSGQSTVVADADADTLNLAAGSNVTITTNASTDTVTISSTDTNTVPNDATITISAGTDLSGGGSFTTDQSSNETITINHADTSTLSGTYGSTSNGTKIDQITVDANGHVTAITTGATGDIQGVTAGSGLTGGGTSGTVTVSHADTSTQASVNNSGRTYIQDITLDTYGHITGITSATETVTNTNQLTTFQLEDGDGTEVTISHGKEVKFVEGTGIDINWTDTSTGSDGDPYDMTFAVTSAPKWTTARTLSLSGDASGSVSWDGSANATLSVTVADDSHNHTIANVDGLQTALDGKLSTTGKAADSELLDGVNGASYMRSDADDNVSGHTEWQDGYQVRLGNGADTRLWHDGTNTYMRSYKHGQNIYFQGGDLEGTNTAFIYMRGDASRTYVQLYENSEERLRTVSDGVDIYGSLDASGSVEAGTADGGAVIRNWTGGDTYAMFGTANMTGNEYALITNGTHTWLGSGTSGTTYIRGPVNSSTAEIRVTSSEVVLDSSSVVIPNQIVHEGDTNTYMQFHAADQWRVVTGGTERLEVKNSSPHVLVTGDLNSTSDARLKENVEPIANALSDVTQLEGVSFDWKDTGTRGHGFIAQQVEPILPDVVQTDEETGIKSINYVGMIGHLVEAIKEQQTQIDELKAEIEVLKS